ncbi:hypothetical protein CL621_01285 [archaeon]|nr:hypothetical protein [archaeon]
MKDKKYKIELSVRRLEVVTKRLITTRFIGNYQSVFKGRGLEFEDYREYTHQDDAGLIDWKASLRSNKLLIKEFVEERELNVFFLVDVSSSMVFTSTGQLKNVYAINLIASLTYAILHAGDKVGCALFNDKITKTIIPKSGEQQFYLITSPLIDPKTYGGNYNLSAALNSLLESIPRHSLVFVISDFIGLKEDWEKSLKLAAPQFDIIGLMIRDPRDEKLPEEPYQVVISDPYSGRKMVVDLKKMYKKYLEYVTQEEKKIRKVFQEANADFLKIVTNESFIPKLINLFNMRMRKWR